MTIATRKDVKTIMIFITVAMAMHKERDNCVPDRAQER